MKEYSMAFVCLLGIGTVFVGLICIIALCKLVSFICLKFEKKEKQENIQTEKHTTEIPNRKKIIAAVSAVIAEEMGTDISAIRIKSFKKL